MRSRRQHRSRELWGERTEIEWGDQASFRDALARSSSSTHDLGRARDRRDEDRSEELEA
jgi:hypothetical protein